MILDENLHIDGTHIRLGDFFWSELENTTVGFGTFGRTVKTTELLRSSCVTKSIPCLCGQMNLLSWYRQSTGQRMGYLERKHF